MGWEPYRVLARNVQNTNAVWVICMTNKVISYGSEKKKKKSLKHILQHMNIFIFSGNDRSKCPRALLIQTPYILPELMWDLTLHHDILILLPEKPMPLTPQLWGLFISSLKLGTAKQRPSVTLLRFFNSPPQLFGWEY